MLKDHLEQLVKAGYLKEFVVDPRNQEARQGARPQRNPLPPTLGVIEVIHTTPRGSQVSKRRGVLTMVSAEGNTDEQPFNKKLKYNRDPIAFDDNDREGTIQPHEDALVRVKGVNREDSLITITRTPKGSGGWLCRGFGESKDIA